MKELSEPFALSGPAISKHLKVLERSGLIARRREAQWRPCQLTSAPIEEAVAWMAQCRVEQDARFDRLEAYLKTLQHPDHPDHSEQSEHPPRPESRDVDRDPTTTGA